MDDSKIWNDFFDSDQIPASQSIPTSQYQPPPPPPQPTLPPPSPPSHLSPHNLQKIHNQLSTRISKIIITIIGIYWKELKRQQEQMEQEDESRRIVRQRLVEVFEGIGGIRGRFGMGLGEEMELLRGFMTIKQKVLSQIPPSCVNHFTQILNTYLTQFHTQTHQLLSWLYGFITTLPSPQLPQPPQPLPITITTTAQQIDHVLQILINIAENKLKIQTADLHNLFFLELMRYQESSWNSQRRLRWVREKKGMGVGVEELTQERIRVIQNLISKQRQQSMKKKSVPIPQPIPKPIQTHSQKPKKQQRTSKLISYIQSQFTLPAKTLKQIAKVIEIYQQIFIKNFLKKILFRSYLRNPRHTSPTSGNEFKYFSPKNSPKINQLLTSHSLQSLLVRQTSHKNFQLYINHKKYLRLTYPNKLKLFHQLQSNQFKQQQQLLQQVQRYLASPSVAAVYPKTARVKGLRAIVEETVKEGKVAVEEYEEEAVIGTNRLRVTVGVIKDVMMDEYQGMFGTECSMYRSY